MISKPGHCRIFLVFIGSFLLLNSIAQNRPVDNLLKVLASERSEKKMVMVMCDLSGAYNSFDPDSARIIAEEALFLAQRLKFEDGESKALGKLANAFNQIGNYPRALEFYLQRLKIEEKRNIPQNLANVNLNIGTVYVYQEEFDNGLAYYYRADSIIKTVVENNTKELFELRYSIALDIGDLYYRINKLDSSYIYFLESLALAARQQNQNFMGTSMVGLGEVYQKQKNYPESKRQFLAALTYLQENGNEDLICETYFGLACLHDSLRSKDSARYFANSMLSMARKDGFMRWQLKAAEFLNSFYRSQNRIDSAYEYLVLSQALRDSINNNDHIRQLQIMSSNEQLRQSQMAEQKRLAAHERKQQLQLLLIGLCIPLIFLITVVFSRIRIKIWVIRTMGIISLLILFEYLTLLLHPYVADLTNHTPIYELLIFVCIAAVLIRAHHRIEEMFVHVLIKRRHTVAEGYIKTKRVRLKVKKPPESESGGDA
jgi:tetratricopeptide (TPR) repeat protein